MVNGLWSVKTVKDLPSRKYLKWRMAEWTAKSSRSKAEYLLSLGLKALEKKARGFQEPSVNCSSTAPIPSPLASVVRAVGAEG